MFTVDLSFLSVEIIFGNFMKRKHADNHTRNISLLSNSGSRIIVKSYQPKIV